MKPLVLLHGFLGQASTFDRIVAALDRPVLPLDLGEPSSITDQLSASLEAEADRLLDAIEAPSFDLLGYSLGGRVALHIAERAPDRVDRLILESAHPGLPSDQEREERRRHDARWAGRIREQWPDVLDDWYRQSVFASLLGSELRQMLIEDKSTSDPVRAARQLEAWSLGRQADHWSFLEERKGPTLFISGEMDPRYSAIGERLAAASGPIRHIPIAGAGHVVHREQPEAYLAALRSFL
jgi:2-succinyl-6-hydroxy-2,4-cyclohexadiene-1-carboxylate synthase